MRLSAIVLIVMGAASNGIAAQENSARGEVRHKSGFYERGVDFWKIGNDRTSKPRVKSEKSGTNPGRTSQDIRRSIWAEPVKMADGRYSIYLPPQAVLQFLENPTPETLEGYMAWKKERASKLKKAMRLLQAYNARESKARTPQDSQTETVNSRSLPFNVVGRAAETDATGLGRPPSLPAATLRGGEGPAIQIIYFHQPG